MLPVHTHDKLYKSGFSIQEKFSGWIRLIFSDKGSRNLFLFLLLNLSMAFVELAYGIWTNSLGLISDSFHMFFDCTALLAGLAASIISKWRPNNKYPYGYVRAEVLAGFVNGLFLIFIAFFIFSEAVERLFEPPEVHHERLFLISVLGFIVNLVGIFAFQHGGAHHGHSHSGAGHGHSHGGVPGTRSQSASHNSAAHGHSHDAGHHNHSHDVEEEFESGSTIEGTTNKIFQGVFLHILADTLGSVGVIISSLLIYAFGWMIADPICSVFIAILISISVIPLLGDSVGVLMQRQPKELDSVLPNCLQRVSQLEGVYGVHEPHFWTLCSEIFIGTLKVEVSPTADTKYVQTQTHNIFKAAGIRQLYVQIDYAQL